MLETVELTNLLELGRGASLKYDLEETFVDAFLRQTNNSPDATAAIDEFGSLSYRELDVLSSVLACRLIENGVNADDFVAIKLPRIKEFLVSAIGIWKAGAAYVPIDPLFPEERINYIMADSGAKVVIDETWFMADNKYSDIPCVMNKPTAGGIALMIYTSGTTGVPKGVLITHAGLRAHCSWQPDYLEYGAGSRIAEISPFCYVLSCTDLFSPLMIGASVYILSSHLQKDIPALDSYLRNNKINSMCISSQLGGVLLSEYNTPLDTVALGGSKVVVPENCKTRIGVGYGLTETCAAVLAMEVTGRTEDSIPVLGRPMPGVTIMLEDADGQPVSRGEIGEVCISSPQVAAGYWHNPTLTEDRFVRRSWSEYPVFRSGDLGRWNEEGIIEFHGRVDEMVKIRGNRVEIGEVESSLVKVDGILSAVVVVKNIGDDLMLCAFYTSEKPISESIIRTHLAEFLPDYMIPGVLIRLDVMPLTLNGKIDRKALPEPELHSEEYVAPSCEMEKIICDAMKEVIGINVTVGINDRFVSLGGNSISAMHLSAKLQKSGIDLSVSQILRYQTASHLSLKATILEDSDDDQIVVEKKSPLHESARFIYLNWERDRSTLMNNIPRLYHFKTTGCCDIVAALKDVFAAYPYLNVRIVLEDGVPYQVLEDGLQVEIEMIVLESVPDMLFFRSLIRPYDLIDNPLYHLAVISVRNESGCWLFMDVNHIIFDGYSYGIFLRALCDSLNGVTLKKDNNRVFVQFQMEELWQDDADMAKKDEYLDNLLEGVIPTTVPESRDLEHDSPDTASVLSTIPFDILTSFVRKEGFTASNIFLTAVLSSLQRFTRQEDICVTIGHSGRTRADVMGCIGMFVKTWPAVSRDINSMVWTEAVRIVQEQMLATYEMEYYPFARLRSRYGWKPEVTFIYEDNMEDGIVKPDDFEIVPVYGQTPSMVPVWIGAARHKNGYGVLIQYDSTRYSMRDMQYLATMITKTVELGCSKESIRLCDMDILSEEARKKVLEFSMGEFVQYDRSITCVDAIVRNATLYPEYPAIVAPDGVLTYSELDSRSNAVAHWLLDNNPERGSFVAMLMEESTEFYIASLGIMKAGCGYIPMDITYPEERLEFMLADSGARVVIRNLSAIDFTKTAPINLSTPEGPSMLLYTSGSTGKPKGAYQQHKSLWTMAVGYIHDFQMEHKYCYAAVTSPSYALSLPDTYGALCVGATLCVSGPDLRKDIHGLARYINEHQIRGLGISTALGKALISSRVSLGIEYMILAGEKVGKIETTDYALWNGLGSTETHYMTYHKITGTEDVMPLGRPAPNMKALLLDEYGKLVPVGCIGELCIVGDQLVKCYWKREKLTSERFKNGIYHTGDLAYWNEDGELMPAGRKDNMIKVRGYRIELEEIEKAAMGCIGVTGAAAAVRGTKEEPSVCLFYTSDCAEPDFSCLERELPPFMIPKHLVRLDALPVNVRGKLDRNALPDLCAVSSDDILHPITDMEKQVFDVVSSILGTDSFGVTSNLLQIGLSSIGAMKLCFELEHRVGISLRMSDVIEHPTVRDIAALDETETCFGTVQEVREYYPLTYNQMGVYIDWVRNPDKLQYNNPSVAFFSGVRADVLSSAVRTMFNVHPYLKCRIESNDGDLVQHRLDGMEPDIICSVLPDDTDIAVFFQGRVRPFNLDGGELCRVEIYTVNDGCYLFTDIHHIITDGYSDSIRAVDFRRILEGQSVERESYTAYDYSIEEEAYSHTERYDADGVYFRELLKDASTVAYPGHPSAEKGLGSFKSILPREIIRKKSMDAGVTPNIYILSQLSEVVSRVSRQKDNLICTVSSGRESRNMSNTQGFFVKTLPVIWRGNMLELQSQLSSTILHQQYPFTKIVEEYGIRPQILYAFEDGLDIVRDYDGERISLTLNQAKFPLSIIVFPGNDGNYCVEYEYDKSLYSDADISILIKSVATMIDEGKMVTAEEEREMIRLGIGKSLDYDCSQTFVDMFEAQVRRTPDNVAVVFQDKHYTYSEVDAITSKVAGVLIENGVVRETVVGIMIDRSERMVLYPLSVMKADGSYLPLDVTYPSSRLQAMCDDAEVGIIISEGNLVKERLADYGGIVLTEPELMEPSLDAVNFPRTHPEDRFVILYTSGSTGKPKGVELEYRGIVNFCHWYVKKFEMTETDRSLAYASFSFDAHMMDIYPALSCGASVYIVSSDLRLDVNSLNCYMEAENISIAFMTTQLGHLFVSTIDNNSLRLLSVSGEKLMPVKKPRYKLYNAGAPTECTIYAFYYPIESDYDSNVIGFPLDNVEIFVVDSMLDVLPKGMSGEMLIGGRGVGRGYLNRPELTGERFFEWKGRRVYRTGDLVRWNDNGELEYIGRTDNQVKLRGYRIELGEIESVASRCPNVDQVVAIVRNDMLCLYYTGDADETELHNKLSDSLADYMVPGVFIRLESMPLTPNGKINRKSLPEPASRIVEYVAPSNEKERKITEAMRSVLNRGTPVGVTDGFYSIGGDSIKAMRLVNTLRREGLLLSVSQIIKLQTAAKLASEAGLSEGDDGLMTDYMPAEPPVSEFFSSESEYERVRDEFSARGETILRAYPLTPMQEGMLLKHLSEPFSWGYRIVSRYSLDIVPEERHLRTALDLLSAQHEVLRTSIVYRDVENPLQVIADRRLELGFENAAGEEDILRIHRRELDRGFDLERDSLFRLICIRTGECGCQILVAVHHIIVDGWSLPIYLGHLFGNLRDAMAGSVTEVTCTDDGRYGRYVMSLRCLDTASALGYWRTLLEGYETRAEIPSFGKPDGEGSGQIYLSMDASSTERLQMLVSDNSSSLANAVELAWGIVLQRYCRQDDVVFARVVSGRNHCGEDMDTVVGPFINSVPVRIKTDPGMDVQSALRMVSSQGAASSVWDYCGMSDIQSVSVLGSGLFQSILAFENYPVDTGTISSLTDGLNVVPVSMEEEPFNDIALAAYVTYSNELRFRLTYDVKKYNRSDMERLVGSCRTVLVGMLSSPSARIVDLSLITLDEERELIRLGTGDKLDYDRSQTFVDMFEAQVRRTPDNVAVVFQDKHYTYSEVDAITSKVACILIERGCVRETVVGIMIDRSERMVMYPLSVMKAGGSYLPLDTSYPSGRLQMMCDDAGVSIIISEGNLVEERLANYGGIVLTEPELMESSSEDISLPQTRPEDRFVILYTSGSTGTPKGVELEYSGMVNFCHWYVNEFEMTEADRSLAYASFSFDAHLMDIYPALSCGASIYILHDSIRFDIQCLNTYIENENITIAYMTTRLGQMFVETTDNKSLRLLSVGGEKLNAVRKPHYKFYNGYGPTECTIYSTFYNISRDYECDIIGNSLSNVDVYVLDCHMSMVPKGVIGELFIGGYGVGRGYLNRPELTEERFIEWRGQRVYRTGDLVRWNDDGELEFIGRIDKQVKLRGYRIELGEIESVASRCEGIGQAVVLVRDDVLCLYYTGDAEESALRGTLSDSLADYMVPGVFIRLESMPLTPNGKIDRKSLPEPELVAEDVVLPSTPQEQSLYDLVSESLRMDSFGVTTNLVSAGMTSISAMRLSMGIRSRFGASVPMTDLLSHPTVRELCDLISHSTVSDTGFGVVQSLREYYPLTPNQLGVYIDWEGHRDGLQYNVPAAVKLEGISALVLRGALKSVIDSHPILKMRLAVVDGDVVMRKDDALSPEVTVSPLPAVDESELHFFFQSRVRPFDLFSDTLYRFEIYEGDGSVYLFKDIHHIVTDGLSEGMLLREMLSCCTGRQPEKEVYTAYDYSLESQAYSCTEEYESDGDYFRNLMSGMESTTYPRSHNASGSGHSRTASMSVRKGNIVRSSSQLGVTVNTYMLHSLLQVLRSITREDRVLVTTVSHGRSHACIENCQGFFVRTLPVVSTDSAEELQRQLVSSMSHEEFPFTKLVDETGIRPEILYAYEGQLVDAGDGSGLITEVYPLSLDTPKVPLTITVNPDRDDVFELVAEYDDSLFSGRDMEILLRCVSNMAEYGRLVSEEEERELIRLGTGEHLEYDRSRTFVDMFVAQVRRTPDNVAVVFQDRRYTYSEVDTITSRIAGMLIEKGVIRETVVGIMIDRSERMVLYPLSVMKAGGSYLPLDTSYPSGRLQTMCDDAGVSIIISEGNLVDEKLAGYAGIVLKEPEFMEPQSNDISLPQTRPEDRFVILYTSGSTGIPKGVELEYRSIVNFCHWYVKEFKMTEADRSLAYASFSFDAHMIGMYPALTCGAATCIVPSEVRMDPMLLNEYMERNSVSIAFLTTQMACLLMSSTVSKSLRLLSFGGEKLPSVRKQTYQMYHVYGPTECTLFSSFFHIEKDYIGESAPIGHSLDNYQCYVLDGQMSMVPRGAVGELFIGGYGVGRGYLNRPELTNEKFIEWRGQRVYSTGDLVRWNDDGELEFIGRTDNQVKIRGFRIELGEIESVASRCEGVDQVVAMVRGDVLCLYYTGDAEESDLRDVLSGSLASYMVPGVFIHLESMSLTLNGKIDRKSLPEPGNRTVEYVAPSNEKERMITEAMRSVLNRDTPVGVMDGFYSIGGDSIKAMRLVSVLRRAGILLAVSQIIKLQTAARLASEAELSNGDDGLMADYMPAEPPVSEAFASESEYERVRDEFSVRGETILRAYPLTPMQEGMLLKHLSEPSSWGYRIVSRYSLDVVPEERHLRTALDVLSAQHEVLRTDIVYRDVESPLQVITDRRLELGFENAIDEDDILRIHRRELDRGFDLERDSLLRLVCIRTGVSSCQILVAVHHIIVDGWSLPLYMGHLFGNLRDAMDGRMTEVTHTDDGKYGRFVRSLRCLDKVSAIEYWKNLLDGYETRADIPSSVKPDGNGSGQIYLSMDVSSTESLQTLVSDNSSSLANAVELAWGIVLQRYCRQDDVVFARVVSGRNHCGEDMDTVVGPFINSVPVRIKTDPCMDVRSALRMVSDQGAESSAWDYCGMSDIQSASALGGGLFQSILAFENYPVGTGAISELKYGFRIEPVAAEEESFNDIALAAYVTDAKELQLHLTYDVGKYNRADMERLVGSCRTILAGMVSSPFARIGDLSLTTSEEERELIRLGTGEHLDYDRSQTFVDMFVEQVRRTPDNVAVVDCDSRLTYRELDERSNAVAHRLIEERKVSAGDFVAVMLPRRKEFVVAVLGTWKAGAAYVPIDPEYPEERRRFMLEDSEAKVVVDEVFFSGMTSSNTGYINLSHTDGLAYMIYTSGSTGKPKGVVVSQSNLSFFMSWLPDELELRPEDGVAEFSSFSFDASVCDLYPSLVKGAALHILSSELCMDLYGLSHYIEDYHISGMTCPTQLGMELLNAYDLKLRYMVMGGEKLKPVRSTSVKLYNGYGPTEFTVWSSHHVVDQSKDLCDIPIGHPVPASLSLVSDAYGRILPRGAVGELCLSGPQLAKGYWHRLELTSERFVECPYLPGEKMYRTGDLVRWNDDGELEFIGRIDNQVKLRGFRIELGEIESVASRCEGVGQAVAMVRNGVLCLYYTGEAEDSDLRESLSCSLASYMVPGVFIHLESMPLTPNGKIDRKSLPEFVRQTGDYVQARTYYEKIICQILSEELRVQHIGVTDSLKSYGMNSIMAMKILLRLKQNFQISVQLRQLSQYDTVADIASHFEGQHEGCSYWMADFDESKHVLVLVCGVITANTITEHIQSWLKEYNILILQPIFNSWPDYDNITYSEILRRYEDVINSNIPLYVGMVSFIGFSFGGALAYHLAMRWENNGRGRSFVLMGDTISCEIDESKLSLNRDTDIVYQAQKKMFDTIGKLSFPSFCGNVTLISAINDNYSKTENEMNWISIVPNIRIVKVYDTHQGLFYNASHYDLYFSLLKEQ